MSELQKLKTWDEVQWCVPYKDTGYLFLETAGHGYLVVPVNDKHAKKARRVCKYGFVGKLAYYLEEDCEIWEFLNLRR